MKKITASLLLSLFSLASLTSLTFALSAPAHAQTAPAPAAEAIAPDPAAVQAVQDLFAAMNYRSLMGDMMRQISQGFGASVRAGAEASIKANPKLSDAERQNALAGLDARLAPTIRQTQTLLNDPALVNEILDETVPLYASHFTAAEIEQIAAFYRSPVGTKTLTVLPQLTAEAMQIGQRVVARHIGPLVQQLQGGAK